MFGVVVPDFLLIRCRSSLLCFRMVSLRRVRVRLLVVRGVSRDQPSRAAADGSRHSAGAISEVDSSFSIPDASDDERERER